MHYCRTRPSLHSIIARHLEALLYPSLTLLWERNVVSTSLWLQQHSWVLYTQKCCECSEGGTMPQEFWFVLESAREIFFWVECMLWHFDTILLS